MTDESEKRELQNKFDEYKGDIASLRAKLNELNSQKESFYEKLQRIKEQISEVQKEKKHSLTERNSITKQVRHDKEKRGELNSRMKAKIEEKRKLLAEKSEIERKFSIRGNPSAIKEAIDNLEMKIQTDVMGLEKEKALMKKIKALKKQYDECKKISDVWDKIRIIDKDIDSIKREADNVHKKIQSEANTGQEMHEEAELKGVEVVELDSKNEETFRRYGECKRQFMEVKKQLEEKLAEMGKIGLKLGEMKEESRTDSRKKQNMRLKELEDQVKKKIEKREKLTTQDLLIFQKAQKED
jgi:uncharacterized coiled-coil DUF342 family protein